jgi:hypothetical protein
MVGAGHPFLNHFGHARFTTLRDLQSFRKEWAWGRPFDTNDTIGMVSEKAWLSGQGRWRKSGGRRGSCATIGSRFLERWLGVARWRTVIGMGRSVRTSVGFDGWGPTFLAEELRRNCFSAMGITPDV